MNNIKSKLRNKTLAIMLLCIIVTLSVFSSLAFMNN